MSSFNNRLHHPIWGKGKKVPAERNAHRAEAGRGRRASFFGAWFRQTRFTRAMSLR